MKSYNEVFSSRIRQKTAEIEASPGGFLLDEEAREQLRGNASARVGKAAGDWIRHLLADMLKDSNPLLAYDPGMMTREEIDGAVPELRRKYEAKERIFPERLERNVRTLLDHYADAMKELLSDLAEYRTEIGAAVFGGREYRTVSGLAVSGDTHNHGRATVIVETDAGKLVYKPHSCRVDAEAYAFMNAHFSDIIRIPRTFVCGDRFGAAEFLEKKTAEGDAQAARYYRALGGTAAVLKMLGSKDMHMENLFACGDRIAVIDLETLFYPFADREQAFGIIGTFPREDRKALYDSLLHSGWANTLMRDGRFEGDFSILINTGEEGSAPRVDGERKNVLAYEEEFFSGFSEVYDRCMRLRPELEKEITARFSGTRTRYIAWATKAYADVQKRLNSFYSYRSEEYFRTQLGKLPAVLERDRLLRSPAILEAETEALREFDIPFFYTRADSRDLFCDGKTVMKDCFAQSGVERTREILAGMSEKEKAFEIQFLRLSVHMAKVKDSRPRPAAMRGGTLSAEQAAAEAERILDAVDAGALDLTSGTRCWLSFSPAQDNPDIMNAGLYSGFTGLAVFFAAMADASENPAVREKASACLYAALRAAERYFASGFPEERVTDPRLFPIGEGDGLAGVLRALVLTERIRKGTCGGMIRRACDFLERIDPEKYTQTDKSSGLAGMISTLGRYEELYGEERNRRMIRALARRLASMQTLEWEGGKAWKTLEEKEWPLSGAVHGMTGIAEALFLAGLRLGTDEFAAPARDALAFEDRSFHPGTGEWEDRRMPGSHRPVHSNCYGPEGMGIVFDRLIRAGIADPALPRNAERAAASVRRAEPLPLDHLCCGNMSIAEYYLATGCRDEAGEILAAVIRRKEQAGDYLLGFDGCRPNRNVTLFYGLAGIGYELLRYTDSGRYPSVV